MSTRLLQSALVILANCAFAASGNAQAIDATDPSVRSAILIDSTTRIAPSSITNHATSGALSERIDRIGTTMTTPSSVQGFIWTISLTSLFILQDHQLHEETHEGIASSPFLGKASTIMVDAGNGAYQMGFAGLLGLSGYMFDDKRAKVTAGQCLEGIFFDGVIVQILKHISGRESPNAATRLKGRWVIFPNPHAYQQNPGRFFSFPSGHISTTVTTLTILMNNYEELRPYRPIAYGLTAAVGISLVGKGMHWYSDLPLGIFLGHVIGTAVSGPHTDDSMKVIDTPDVSLRVAPSVQINQLRLYASLSF